MDPWYCTRPGESLNDFMPLRDWLTVRPERRALSQIIHVPINSENWTRGEVVRTGTAGAYGRGEPLVRPGDAVYFEENREWPALTVRGETLLVIQEADVAFVAEGQTRE